MAEHKGGKNRGSHWGCQKNRGSHSSDHNQEQEKIGGPIRRAEKSGVPFEAPKIGGPISKRGEKTMTKRAETALDPELLQQEYEQTPLWKRIQMDVLETVDLLDTISEGKKLHLETIEPDPDFIHSLPGEPREMTILWKVEFNRELTERGRLTFRPGATIRWYWAPNKTLTSA